MLIKHIIKLSDLKQFVKDDSSCIELKKKCSRRLNLLPGQFSDIKKSVKEHLHSIITTYDTVTGSDGIILNFKNIKIQPLVALTEDINVGVNYVSDVYIFRPQVDRILKGTVNKKSKDHVGCLVHKYFNATISRPDEVDFDNWTGKQLNIGDEILFKVFDVDLSRRLPYIRGCFLDSDCEIKSTPNRILAQPTSSDLNSDTLTPFDKITKLINPNLSSSDEESSSRKKRKRPSGSRESSEKEKLPFRSTQLTVDEERVDNSVKRKRRKISY